MTDKNLINMVAEFNKLVAAFKYSEAHEKYYHNELIKHENEDAPTIGLDNHKKEMKVFLSKISNQSAEMLNTIISDDISVTEWHYRFDHSEWGKRDFREVSIQRWREGKIIHERHLYKTEKW